MAEQISYTSRTVEGISLFDEEKRKKGEILAL